MLKPLFLCLVFFRSSLHFTSEISVEALVGVTVDKQNILLMNINKSTSHDPLALSHDQLNTSHDSIMIKKEPAEPPKNNRRRRKSSSPVKPKPFMPPNQISTDLSYHRPWDQDLRSHLQNLHNVGGIKAEPPFQTTPGGVKAEPSMTSPRERDRDKLPHSELRAHLQSGLGTVPKMPFPSPPAGGKTNTPLMNGGIGSNHHGNQLQQQLTGCHDNGNNNNVAAGCQGNNTPSNVNTRSALYQHLQQQQVQKHENSF